MQQRKDKLTYLLKNSKANLVKPVPTAVHVRVLPKLNYSAVY
jgi:hypothetical protein